MHIDCGETTYTFISAIVTLSKEKRNSQWQDMAIDYEPKISTSLVQIWGHYIGLFQPNAPEAKVRLKKNLRPREPKYARPLLMQLVSLMPGTETLGSSCGMPCKWDIAHLNIVTPTQNL